MTTLYATVSDLQQAMDGTDSGTGTASQLTTAQLTLALTAASTRVSAYAGNEYDSSTPEAVPPDIFHDLCLDLAVFWATTTYMKHKVISPTHPVWLRYSEAMKVLNQVRTGELRLDVVPPGGVGQETGLVINRLPNIFTGRDSNTRYNPGTGGIEADTPDWMFTPSMTGGWDSAGWIDPVGQG